MPKSSAQSSSITPSEAAGSEVCVNELQFFIHNDSDALRIELAGSLSGPNVESVLQAWQKEISTDARRPVVADISYVADADKDGRALLVMWHHSGVRIVARSLQSWAFAEPIVSDPVEAAAAKRCWLRRLIDLLAGPPPRCCQDYGRNASLIVRTPKHRAAECIELRDLDVRQKYVLCATTSPSAKIVLSRTFLCHHATEEL